jgi:hypothetical protein
MTRSPEVDAWFARLDHPLKPAMLRIREALLEGDPRLEECIKWQCPTFTFEGNLASINPLAQKHVSLLVHTGAHIPGRPRHLEGGGGTARVMKFADLADVEAKRPALAALARVWCDWKASGTRSAAKARKPVRKPVRKKVPARKAPGRKVPAKKTKTKTKTTAVKRPAARKTRTSRK